MHLCIGYATAYYSLRGEYIYSSTVHTSRVYYVALWQLPIEHIVQYYIFVYVCTFYVVFDSVHNGRYHMNKSLAT